MTNHWLQNDYFNDLIVIDENGESHIVPCETAWYLPDSKTMTHIRLPVLYWSETPNYGLVLLVWTLYQEDMDQIVEQVIARLSSGGVYEGKLKLQSVASQKDSRILKYIFRFSEVT